MTMTNVVLTPLGAPVLPTADAAGDQNPFAALGLSPRIVRALVEEKYETPTPIQAAVIPHAIAGRDVIGCAQTGTGKTAAFVLPILHRLAESPRTGAIRALVLAPTRELAAQIAERATAYGRHMRLGTAVVYGGVSYGKQRAQLQRRPDLLIATPGRLMDFMQQGDIRLDGVTTFVLDEADRMLDIGFLVPVQRIASTLQRERHTMLFSATMPRPIEQLARTLLVDPARVAVTPPATTATLVEQAVMMMPRSETRGALERLLRNDVDTQRVLVFTRTKHGASRLSDQLDRAGFRAAAIHGNKSQSQRERALDAFRTGRARVLVATDVAARGIDVDGISHVINYDLPNEPDAYVHRIGRTGRAGAAGRALSFCDQEERGLLADIERSLRRRLPVIASC